MAHQAAEEAVVGPTVLSVSARNKKVRTIQVDRPTPQEVNFLPALFKGLGITLKHFFINVATKRDVETLQYPEETIDYPKRSRGLHRLMLRDDDTVRCVACMCCPTVCPANCITIIPAERDDQGVEKYPAVFEIDELRCVVCGLCVESCPCDAIRMDTGVHAPSVEHRSESVLDKKELLSRGSLSIAKQGGSGSNWRE